MKFSPFIRRLLQLLRRRNQRRQRRGRVTIGVVAKRDVRHPFVVLPPAVRCRHLGMVGLSGSGKTYFIEHLIRQDIRQGTGFVLFDVHGDLADSVIRYLAERASTHREVYERTVILEPFDPERSFGFNPLERTEDTSPSLQAKEFAYMLRKRWKESLLSPRTEELLQHALYTLAVNGETLLRLPLLLTAKHFRSTLVSNTPSAVQHYWRERYDALSQKMQAVIREPILTRVSSFISDPLMGDIVGQSRSTFSFRTAFEKGLWVVCNLSQGQLGENATILGSMLFTKLELEVMALARVAPKKRKLFVVYADELQHFTSDTFARLIAEARKYRIAIVAGHQYWRQLDPALRQAMLAVGTKLFFRLHYHDAVELAGEVAAGERARYIKLLTILERGEAVARVGRARPLLISVPSYRSAKPTAEEIQTLRTESARRHTTLRSTMHSEPPPAQNSSPRRGNKASTAEELTDHGR